MNDATHNPHTHHHGATGAAREVAGLPAGRSAARAPTPAAHGGHDHGAMIADFRRRFLVSAVLTVPILALSPMIQHWLGIADDLDFPGSLWVLFALSSIVFLYGGKPFLTGIVAELRNRQPGMMTLISLAIAPTCSRRQSSSVSAASRSTGNWRRSSTSCSSATGS